jgi:hypothetical protein
MEVAESTAVTFAVNDPSGGLLVFKTEEFKPRLEFSWTIPGDPLPPGSLSLVIEIGDRISGIHTHKEFHYRVATKLQAIQIEAQDDVRVSDLLRVRITPALVGPNGPVTFENARTFDSLTDAAGEAFYPLTPGESQRYIMRIKVGGVVVKTTDGEVVGVGDKLVVDFESAVDDNLDFATGFSIDFQFRGENGALTPLALDSEPFIAVKSRLVAQGDPLVPVSDIQYGANVSAVFRLKDEEADRYLAPGRAFPVLVVLDKNGSKVLLEKKAKYIDEKYRVKLQIGAAVPSEDVVIAIKIRKAGALVDVLTSDGVLYASPVRVVGAIKFTAKVKEQGKYAIVAFRASANALNLSGTAFSCTILGSGGDVVAVLPLAQKKRGSELTWNTEGAKGSYLLELRRAAAPEGPPLFTQSITLDGPVAGIVSHLPVEGIAIGVAFGLFAWAISLRSGIRVR